MTTERIAERERWFTACEAVPPEARACAAFARRAAAWSDEARRVPPAWVERLAAGDAEPRAHLCRHLDTGWRALDRRAIIAALARPELTGLTHLSLPHQGLTSADVALIAQQTRATPLVALDLSANIVTGVLAQMARGEIFTQVVDVALAGCGIREDIEGLSAAPLPGSVEPIDRQGAQGAAPQARPRWQRVDLGENFLHPHHVAQLAAHRIIVGPQHVSLSGNSIRAPGVEAWCLAARADGLPAEVDLASAQLEDAGVIALARSPALRTVRALTLNWNRLTDRSARALADAAHADALETLRLVENALTEEGAAALLTSPRLPRLRALDLSDLDLDDQGAAWLARVVATPPLDDLLITGGGFTEVGARALRDSPLSRSVGRLRAFGTLTE